MDTITEHMKVVQEKGYCWWAKIGEQPSDKYLQEFIDQENPMIILYKPSVVNICEFGGVARYRPSEGYPKYYESDVFRKEEPGTYFKLKSIKELDLSFLEDYIIPKSEKEVLYDLKKTISSYMIIQHKDEPRKPKPEVVITKPKTKPEPVEETVVDKNSCVYKIGDKCGNKRCINYRYECYHPNLCMKQKIKENKKI